jgi:hypothetical protein
MHPKLFPHPWADDVEPVTGDKILHVRELPAA